MFLKSLTLKGFKSFADTTDLLFEPGVTVVVGPNGSGKSNVVDAIAWVLGAQAPTTVRSQKMDDVIFAGTAERAALGRAEVSLVIDNSGGLLPIEFTEVTITRTLFRTGESEYALNGTPCRLLDIQELLSDSGVGRQQHTIVSQGQIDAVLNARPEERRMVIEEAAGVLKYRKRKEKAERRLAATEANLTRVQDLVREVRRQLRPLERQAEAARRHGDLVEELRALRIHLGGRDLSKLRTRLGNLGSERSEIDGAERTLRRRLADLDTEVLASEAEISTLGEDDLGDALARVESLKERARGLLAVLTEKRRGVERDRAAFVDRDVIATLEAEAERLRGELADVEAQVAVLRPAIADLATSEAELVRLRADFAEQWADGVPAPEARAAETRGEQAALRASVDAGRAEAQRIADRLAELTARGTEMEVEADRLRAELAASEDRERPLVDELRGVEEEVASASASAEEAQDEVAAAEAEHRQWLARAEALAQAVDEARRRAGAEQLATVDGYVGALVDLVQVDEGWEAAFEAAAGEAVGAAVVASVDAARAALAALHAGDASGAVIPVGSGPERRDPPLHGEPVRDHVRGSTPAVERVLDAVVGDAVRVTDWPAAVDIVLADPAAVVVTPSGDRFGGRAWTIGTAGTGATGAALDEARAAADAAGRRLEQARASATGATSAREAAQAREAALTARLDDNDSTAAASADSLHRVEADRRDIATASDALENRHQEVLARVEADAARIEAIAQVLPGLEATETEAEQRARAMAVDRDRLEAKAAEVGHLRTDVGVRSATLDERRHVLTTRLTEIETRLAAQASARKEAESTRAALDGRETALDRLLAYVEARAATIDTRLDAIRARRREQSEAVRAVSGRLDDLRRERSEAEKNLAGLRERLHEIDVAETEVKLRVEAAVEKLRNELDVDPDAAIEAPCPAIDEDTTPAGRVRELERELRLMGPINPLALQEYEALNERHGFLTEQLDDVRSTRRDLQKIIRAVDAEIQSVFAGAYADVAAHYEALFTTLFPGGQGRLRLTDPDDLLNTGIELEARPSGKNVRKLSLLSGGERSLTALAFLFAVFRARPSPFYVMDEVEAALDDVNLHRFLDLVHEFREEAQLLIVSHQKRTMEAADILYGVTMQSGGSSRVLSERVTETLDV